MVSILKKKKRFHGWDSGWHSEWLRVCEAQWQPYHTSYLPAGQGQAPLGTAGHSLALGPVTHAFSCVTPQHEGDPDHSRLAFQHGSCHGNCVADSAVGSPSSACDSREKLGSLGLLPSPALLGVAPSRRELGLVTTAQLEAPLPKAGTLNRALTSILAVSFKEELARAFWVRWDSWKVAHEKKKIIARKGDRKWYGDDRILRAQHE